MITALLVFAFLALLLVASTEAFSRYVRARLPPRGEFIEIDGNRLHYFSEGQGPALLLIHGLNGSGQNFTHSLTKLLAKDHQVVTLDRPGSGYSARLRGSDARLSTQAKVIADFISSKKLVKPLVVGHSMGGAVALQLALDFPGLVSGLALIAPLTKFQEKIPKPFRALTIRPKILRWLFARTLATPLAIFGGTKRAKFIFSPEEIPPDFGFAGGGFLGLDYISYLGASSDLQDLKGELEKLAARYPKLSVPVSILYGKDDLVLDHQSHGVDMNAHGARISVEIVSGGHMLVVTQPQMVREFIVRAESRA